MENYKEISRELIDKSFPVLKHKKIFIIKAPLSFFACSVWLPPFFRVIVFSNRTRHFNRPVITGLIAHELCHQERYVGMGVFKYLRFAAKFLTSRNVQATEEKATDRLTIEKGYGRELYELSELTFSERKDKRLNELYLPLSEIKSYSESLGNWY
jgi:hypothetical protein